MTPARPELFTAGEGLAIRGERVGEGPPLILCHGITATRRYVVHGSRALERAGHTVISYDARGHGESEPAPAGEGYGYPRLVGDLESVIETEEGEGPVVLVGHSMGAHTAVAYTLEHPGRVAGVVVIGPVYSGSITAEGLAYWDGLAAALEKAGVDGFLAYIERAQGVDPAWQESVLRFTRERMLRHRHLDAVVEVAAAYAELLPQARLVSEGEGESPLAWQGGRLSREIAAFCAEPEVGASYA